MQTEQISAVWTSISRSTPKTARAISLRPGVAVFHLNLGNAYTDLGRFDDAVAQWHGKGDYDEWMDTAINNAKRFLEVQKEFGSFDRYIWGFVGGKPKVNRWTRLSQLPAFSRESDALSADLKKRGFKFTGTTIVYAHMQATGLVNDHLVSCFRHKECSR